MPLISRVILACTVRALSSRLKVSRIARNPRIGRPGCFSLKKLATRLQEIAIRLLNNATRCDLGGRKILHLLPEALKHQHRPASFFRQF